MFRENQEREWERQRRENARVRKEQIKEKILFVLIAIFILTITSILNYKLNTSAVDQCIKKGFAKNVCVANL